MTMYVISDNSDTYMGLRLSGVDGEVVHTENELKKAVEKALSDNGIGILLINGSLASLCPELINEIKMKRSTPLVVEIPDRHGSGRSEDAISEYIRSAIGIKI